MLLTRLLNACHHFPGFVYEHACLLPEVNTIEVEVRPRHGSKPRCSGCRQLAPRYDRLSERHFEFIPLWGYAVVLVYCMRRVRCRVCGVKVEQVPWAMGKHTLTEAYMLFLAHWARKLSWTETAEAFHTSWDQVCHAVEYVVQWGLARRVLAVSPASLNTSMTKLCQVARKSIDSLSQQQGPRSTAIGDVAVGPNEEGADRDRTIDPAKGAVRAIKDFKRTFFGKESYC